MSELIEIKLFKINDEIFKKSKIISKSKDFDEIEIRTYDKNIIQLDLSNSNIIKIEGLDKLTKLSGLYLHGNKITNIRELKIDDLIDLDTLYLSCNEISKIECLDKLINLRELSLHDNKITHIENIFNLINLFQLDLNCNLIKTFDVNIFKNNHSLKIIYLCNNDIDIFVKLNTNYNNEFSIYLDYNISYIKNHYPKRFVEKSTKFIITNKFVIDKNNTSDDWFYYLF